MKFAFPLHFNTVNIAQTTRDASVYRTNTNFIPTPQNPKSRNIVIPIAPIVCNKAFCNLAATRESRYVHKVYYWFSFVFYKLGIGCKNKNDFNCGEISPRWAIFFNPRPTSQIQLQHSNLISGRNKRKKLGVINFSKAQAETFMVAFNLVAIVGRPAASTGGFLLEFQLL